MSKFIYGDELNFELVKLIKNSQTYLVFISPFIKLHSRLKDELKVKDAIEQLDLKIVFGKNENNAHKSLSNEELQFFLGFPNIEIRYEPRLHAKYYANDFGSILTSMNLYDFSMSNNIEFGVVSENKKMSLSNLDKDADDYFRKVLSNSELVFKQKVKVKKSGFSFKKSVRYNGVEIIENNLSKYYKDHKKLKYFSELTELVNSEKESSESEKSYQIHKKKEHKGYCIRTGVEIPYNIEKPLSYDAYQAWAKFENYQYPEKFCHYNGEKSFGETSFEKPILKKNWKKAQKNI